MIYLIYGAAGALTVFMLVTAGFLTGWKSAEMFRKRGADSTAEEATEEQLRQLAAQQQAFESMLSYNAETAYGVDSAFRTLRGGTEDA